MKQINTELAIKKRHPEGVALIVCQDKKGKVDITPIGWYMLCNSDPRCWAISLYYKHFSHKVISDTKEFVLCFPSFKQKDDVLYCGNNSGWNINKLKKTKFKTTSSKKIKPPILKDSITCFECKVIKTTKLKDHTIFIGQIFNSYISQRKDKLYNSGNQTLFKWNLK